MELTSRQFSLRAMLLECVRNIPGTDEQRTNALYAASLLKDHTTARMHNAIGRLMYGESADFAQTEEQLQQVLDSAAEVLEGGPVVVELTRAGCILSNPCPLTIVQAGGPHA